jgi:tRNA(fMet)-specific endonuclease VapC
VVRKVGQLERRAVLLARQQVTQASAAQDLRVTYLLDTNACIALMNGKPTSVRAHFREADEFGAEINVSTVVAFELWYGVANSSRPDTNAARVEAFFAGPLHLLAFEEEDARAAGAIRGALEAAGRPLGAYDLLIAGQALRHKVTLVTASVREFSRVKGLAWEDWARA